MTSSKWITGLLAVVLVLALAPSGFAQNIQLSVLNSASASEIAGNRQANVSDPTTASTGSGILISGSVFSSFTNNITTAILTLTFPGKITSGPIFAPTGSTVVVRTSSPNSTDGIRITGQTGIFSTITGITSIDYFNGIIQIALPNFTSIGSQSNGATGSFSLVGVRMDLTGATVGTARSLSTATVTATTGYNAPTSMPVLISNVTAGAPSLAQGTADGTTNFGVATIFTNQTNGSPSDGTASLLLTEPSTTAWRTTTQWTSGGLTSGSAANTAGITGTTFNVSIAGLPAGMQAALATTLTTGTTATLGTATLTSTTTTSVLTLTGTDLTQTDRVGLNITISGVPTTTPITAGVITVTVTPQFVVNSVAANGPVVDTGLNNTGASGFPSGTTGWPKFDSTGNTASFVVGSVISLQTTMLIPFAISSSPYLTSVALSNTSLDNFPAGTATATAGTITFDLFQAGVRNSVTTSASNFSTIGSGLSSNGTLAAGATFQTGMTQLLTAAGLNSFTSWAGYIFITANFPNAHGVTYTFTGTNLTASAEIDVVSQPAITARTQTNESLGF